MGHCDIDSKQDSDAKLAEKAIETKPKEKMKNSSYDKIKHIVTSEKMPKEPAQKLKPQKKKINIDS